MYSPPGLHRPGHWNVYKTLVCIPRLGSPILPFPFVVKPWVRSRMLPSVYFVQRVLLPIIVRNLFFPRIILTPPNIFLRHSTRKRPYDGFFSKKNLNESKPSWGKNCQKVQVGTLAVGAKLSSMYCNCIKKVPQQFNKINSIVRLRS